MPKPRPGLGVSLAIRPSQEHIERDRIAKISEKPAAENRLPPDDVLSQLLSECPSNRAALIMRIDPHLIAGHRERLAVPDPWPGRPHMFLVAAGRVAQARWDMWQETTPPPIGHEDLEQLIIIEAAKSMATNQGADPLTTFGVLAAIRKFHVDHGRWPIRAELAVAMRRAEADIKSKLTLLMKQGYADQDGQTFVPTDTAPASAKVTASTWTPAEAAAYIARLEADKLPPIPSPLARIAKAPVAKPPTAETPQEVQEEMKGTPSPNRPADSDLIQMVESLLGPGITKQAAIAVVATNLMIPEGSVSSWYYAATKLKKQGQAAATSAPVRVTPPTDFLCERCFDSGIVGTNTIHDEPCTCAIGQRLRKAPAVTAQPVETDDDLFAPDPPAPPIVTPPAAALAIEQALGGDGTLEQTDPAAGLTAAQERMPAGALLSPAEAAHVERLVALIDDATRDGEALRTTTPTGEQPETFVQESTVVDEIPGLMAQWDQLTPERQRDVYHGVLILMNGVDRQTASRDYLIDGLELGNVKRDIEIEQLRAENTGLPILQRIVAAKQDTIDKLEAEARELRAAYEGALASYRNAQAATDNNTNVAQLMAENAELQDGLKIALATIEQAATAQPGSVTYILLETADSPIWIENPGDGLAEGDEWGRTMIDSLQRRRVEVWHCIETQQLLGGNIVCILRPGAAETAGQEAA